ncbi:hypothetical protein [Dyella sp.]|uniref:hypothetical protein n=1 Tax=Dyella sp. TaxID=1869338 RepID=UPI002FDB4D81
MGSSVIIGNWEQMQNPLQGGFYGAGNQIWQNQQANADTWASQAKANDDLWRQQHDKDVQAWKDNQSDWLLAWGIAQAAYAAAQVLLAEKSYDAAKDAADKQYDIANRQQTIADDEYARYSAHFAPCENATIDAECARPEYTEDIETEANRAVADIRRQFTVARQQLQRRRQRYCVGPMLAQERQLAIEEARAVADAKEKVRRYLEERQEQRRDKYFNRKLQLFNIGRGIKADAIGELNQSLAGVTAGNDIALAARNQYYGAILSSFGGLIGAGMNFFGGSANGVNVPQSAMSGGGGFVGMPGFAQASPAMWQGVGMAGRVV